jgi:tRNA(adenine34) deaminase
MNSDSPVIKDHFLFMQHAFYEAEKAMIAGEVPVGAVIVHNRTIIGRGHNQVETLNDPTAHAEMIAITAACQTLKSKYLTGCSLYVTLEPCPMCSGALIWSKIQMVVFGASDEKCGSCGTVMNIAQNKSMNHRIEVVQGIMETDCAEILRHFFKKRRSE